MLRIISIMIITITSINSHSDEYYFSSNDKVRILFNTFDRNPKDSYLTYWEAYEFQKLTDPHIEMTRSLWKHICSTVKVNQYIGIDLTTFNESYYIYRDQFGTDLNKDFRIILNLYKNAIQYYQSNII